MNFGEFIRECYLKSTPSVDLNEVTKDNPIDCCDYKLKMSEYKNILKKFCKTDDEELSCNMWMLRNGLTLIEYEN